eukprot:TRINITY_DN2104_c0_g1_i1.p1 TRINITY_DN2104_c0_g1~~TRINITY_DN2104_c0_g1_i1.p1  ORF type:complete len:60 (-),score=4.20 TRINITY_DN2104_c0_g1_i1:384-563(-)
MEPIMYAKVMITVADRSSPSRVKRALLFQAVAVERTVKAYRVHHLRADYNEPMGTRMRI